MKDTFTQKVTAISSCLADCTEASVNPREEDNQKVASNDKSRVRRSATMIGLAISMSATGMVFSQGKAAIAANSMTANTTLPTLPSLSRETSSDETAAKDDSQLAPLSLKHKVQPGESIQQLARVYQVEPVVIAANNHLSLTDDLEPGQTLNIPSARKSAKPTPTKRSAATSPQTEATAAKPLNTSLDHLRETRKRLKDSLAELKIEKSKSDLASRAVVADVSDVSRPLITSQEPSDVTRISVPTETAQEIEIPVLDPTIKDPFSRTETEVQSSASTRSQEQIAAAGVARREDTEAQISSLSNLPSVPSAQGQITAKIKSDEPISLSVTNAETDPSETVETEVNTPQQTSFRQPTAIVPEPRFVPTQKNYRVRPGDTMNSIARRHGISTAELIRANGITNPNLIKVNQALVIPQKGKIAETAQRNDNLAASVNGWQLERDEAATGFVTPNNSEPLDRELSIVQQSYTDQLRDDIATLEQNYGQRDELTPTRPESNQSDEEKTVVGETLNAEWASDRQERQSPQEAIEERLNDQETQVISAAPSNPGIYNDAFEIPVGTNVGPELPGLSNPDDYLPDAPLKFNGHIWPSKGVLTSGFGRRWGRMHKGIDIAAPVGTPIMASAPGEVITAGWNSGGYGNLVKVRHPDGSVTLYAHNSRILVRRGQKVEQGQQIAEMGSTGYSTGPHLHFEIHPNGSGAKNPMAFLPKKRS